MEVNVPIQPAARQVQFTHVLDLKGLPAGTSVLFHATATEVPATPAVQARTTFSEVHMIEVRPQKEEPSGPSNMSMTVVGLLDILEHTRAILRDTWEAAHGQMPPAEAAGSLGEIREGLVYCSQHLAVIRDDPQNSFDPGQKEQLSKVLEAYGQARAYVDRSEAGSAIDPEKQAYQTLSRFIQEQTKSQTSGPPAPKPDEPKRHKLQTRPSTAQSGQQDQV